ncbi:MAG: tRNA 2-selenouridine(34) synthase MnmH [Chitinophagaceae bacterium]|nr:tRNA 2-selenouridine(34) synthase MnmH [Chitinophagaceae bacterium]
MAITRLTIQEFLQLSKQHPVLDVRSPGEFKHACIPGAYSLPLFTDEERKIVGTAYKQESQQKAIKLGLDFFGSKMVKMVEEAETICKTFYPKDQPQAAVLVHCWRGGMRSAGVAWLLDLYGFKVYTLAGGYKVYRKWVLQQFENEYPLQVVGGYTGSGKSELLHELRKKGACVIDLETIAAHKGSAFGNLGMPPQPTQEMFENLLAQQLSEHYGNDAADQLIWIEDESQRIGEVNIPSVFFRQMRRKPLFFLNIPFEERLDFITGHYGNFERDKLINAIIRISKRLGGLETKTAINHLLENNIRACFGVLLHYYDKFYLKSLQNNREDFAKLFQKVEVETVSAEINSKKLAELAMQQRSMSSASPE